MSLKGTERDISLKAVPKVRKAVAQKNADVLAKYVDSGAISTEFYNQLIEEFGAIPTGNPDINLSLKNGVDVSPQRRTEYLNAVEAVQKGKKGAVERLAKYVDEGMIRTEEYDKLVEKYRITRTKKERSRKRWYILCAVLLMFFAFVYHSTAIDKAYNRGEREGYEEGESAGLDEGYKKGYDKGYGFYEDIEDEYDFFHKHAVITTTTGKRYHRYNCHHVRNRNFYIYNKANAEVKGYTPCLDCYD